MIDSIFVALSGLQAHERGLNVISNNVANINTAGFRGSTVNFTDVFVGEAPSGLQSGSFSGERDKGAGVDASRTQIDFRAGDRVLTGADLDLRLEGQGFFVLQDETGEIRYTRNGHFDFFEDELVTQDHKFKVMTRDANGQLVPVSIANLKLSASKPTSELTFDGLLASDDADGKVTIENVDVFDKQGGKHTVKIDFTKDTTTQTPGFVKWKIAVSEGSQQISSGDVQFAVDPIGGPVTLTFAFTNAEASDITLNLENAQSVQSGGTSSLSVSKQDGFTSGTITSRTLDEKGVLKIVYSNGQKADGPKLVLAQISDQNSLVELGDAVFAYQGTQAVAMREAGDDLRVLAQQLEQSNVDLTTQFSQLILMQRGYQASSQVLSTANEMLQQLFDVRGHQ